MTASIPEEVYFLGLDTGATKTHTLITDAAGDVLAFEQGGPGNPQSIGGFRALEVMLTGLVQRACQSADISTSVIQAAGLGLAGYDWPSQKDRFFAAVRSAGLPEQSFLVNDAALGIYAGTTDGRGISVSAGTSFNCRGIGPDGREGRAIGDGLKWGEGAGALELAVKSAQMVIAQWLKTGPESHLMDLFMEKFGAASPADLVEGMVLRRYPVTADLAPLIIEAARQGDRAAHDAVNWAACKLAQLTIGVIRQLELQEQAFEVILTGSFFKAGDILIIPMKAAILKASPLAEFRQLEYPPVCGGVLMAMEKTYALGAETRMGVINRLRAFFSQNST